MITTTHKNGRLGNQIIRNLAVSILSHKHNLKVDYCSEDIINKLGIELFSGDNTYSEIQELTDDNYFTIYNSDSINYNLDPNNSFFQTKEISHLLYNYLHTDIVKTNIMKNNVFNRRYNNNNDLFIHIRLTDVKKYNPGLKYYINAIQRVSFNHLYISTDNPNDPIIKNLIRLYRSAKIVVVDEIYTFQFGSTCKNIVLSHGSFSAIIGYLGFFSNVYYPEYDENIKWCGDMFSINNWIQISVR